MTPTGTSASRTAMVREWLRPVMFSVRRKTQMRLFRKPTMVETITLIAITAILAAVIFIPDAAKTTRRQLERRAGEWNRTTAPVLSESSLIAADMSLIGKWVNRHRLNHSAFTFANRMDGRFDVGFSTGGCLGGCEMSRVGTMVDGAVVLDGAVAEYSGPVYDTIYAIRVNNRECLLPAANVPAFERELNAGSDRWTWHVHSRIDESNEPSGRQETTAPSAMTSASTRRSP